MGQLVDLSLFAVSPTNDYHFALNEPSVAATPRQPTPTMRESTLKPLPPIPGPTSSTRQALATAAQEPPAVAAGPSARCILDRMRRVRLPDPLPPAPNNLAQPSRQPKSLQQRRQLRSPVPELSIPTARRTVPRGGQPATERQHATDRQPLQAPMIWLPEENMWLVADGVADEVYGYYAPAARSDPGLPTEALAAVPREAPPSYAAAMRDSTGSTDDSPVRTQFQRLFATSVQSNLAAMAPSAPVPTRSRSDNAIPPLFQEAMCGVNFVPFRSEALMPGSARRACF